MAMQEIRNHTKAVVVGTALFLSLNCVACGISPERQFAQRSIKQLESSDYGIKIGDPEDFAGKEYKSGLGKDLIILRSANTEGFVSDATIVNAFNMLELVVKDGITIFYNMISPDGQETLQFDMIINPSSSQRHIFIIEDKPEDINSDLGKTDLPAALTFLTMDAAESVSPVTFLASRGNTESRFGHGILVDLLNTMVEVTNNATSVSNGPSVDIYLDSNNVPEDQKDEYRLVFFKVGAEAFSNSFALMCGFCSQGVSYSEYVQIVRSAKLPGKISLGLNVPYIVFSEDLYNLFASKK